MAISTDDYGFAIYGETGLNLIGEGLLSPKLVGRLKLRVRDDFRNVVVVAEDGTELPSSDGIRNIPLDRLREEGMRNAYQHRYTAKLRDIPGETLTGLTYRYQFLLYGNGATPPLLPSVIHGWGQKIDLKKLEMAHLLVSSVVSGLDLQMARVAAAGRNHQTVNGYNMVDETVYASDTSSINTGLPVTVTFRSTALKDGDNHGFGAVSVVGGYLYIEMMKHTEIDVCFYETVGIPAVYFAKCSTVSQPERFGIVAYTYEPPLMKYAQPATDPAELFGKPVKLTGINFGSVARGQYFFSPQQHNTLRGLMRGLQGEDGAARRKLADFLEGDPHAELKYEKYSNAGKRLRLMTNLGSLKKGVLVSRRSGTQASIGHGLIHTIKAGHDYAKAHSPLQHGCFLAGLKGGGVLNAAGGASAYSAFERSFANRPRQVRPSSVADDYNGAPWNPTYTLRRSGLEYLPGMDYYTPILKQSPQAVLGNPTKLDEINKFIHDKTWKIQRWFNVIFKMDDVVGKVPNANYSPEEARKRQEALQDYQQRINTAEIVAELNGTAAEAEYNRIQSEFQQRLSLLELIDNVLDDKERLIADLFPFWGGIGHRHSEDKLELYHMQIGQPTGDPEYLPENWILCRSPD